MISDPLFVLWKAEGAPTCGATWEEEELVEILMLYFESDEPAPNCSECGQMIDGWAHSGGFGNYYCDRCCPVCEQMENDSPWCNCDNQVGYGPCPACGKQMLPF